MRQDKVRQASGLIADLDKHGVTLPDDVRRAYEIFDSITIPDEPDADAIALAMVDGADAKKIEGLISAQLSAPISRQSSARAKEISASRLLSTARSNVNAPEIHSQLDVEAKPLINSLDTVADRRHAIRRVDSIRARR